MFAGTDFIKEALNNHFYVLLNEVLYISQMCLAQVSHCAEQNNYKNTHANACMSL